MKRNQLFTSLKWRVILSLALVIALSLAVTPIVSQAVRKPAAFPPPTPVNPTDQLITVANYPPRAVPYFEWQAVDGATRYRIQIAQDIGFTQIRYEAQPVNTRYLPTGDDGFVDGDIYWRVRVESPSAGDWTTPQHFTRNWATNNAPSLTSPASGTLLRFFEAPTFSWTPVVGAAFYRLVIDNDSNCQTPSYQYDTIERSFNPGSRITNGTYYWSVTTYDKAGHSGGVSECRPFTMQYDLATTLLQPANNSLPVYTPQFQWIAVKGAQAYWIYFTTDSTFQSGVSAYRTTQTTFTPRESLPNDVNYYWKVRVENTSGLVGPDSAIWTFRKQWYHQPIILSPRNNEAANMMLFSWTPVREAAYYRIEVAFDPGFTQIIWNPTTPNTFIWRSWAGDNEWGKPQYIRVRPIDRSNNNGKDSVSISYTPRNITAEAENMFPRYYYTPPFSPTGNYVSPKNIPISYDYTVDTPTFYWSRVFVPGVTPRVEASWYRLEVSQDPNFLSTPDWTYDTQNLSATPTDAVPFVPSANTIYYWRVTPLAALTPTAVLSNSITNQPWAVHIDTSRLITSTTGVSPTLLRPPYGEKAMDTLPSFEWLPYSGAVRYELAISTRSDFATTAYVTQTVYTHHTPNVRLPKDTYFWRVRALNAGGQQVGQWSETRRLIVAYETRRWNCTQTSSLLPTQDGTLLATDASEAGATDLTTLYAAQDGDSWYAGFNYTPTIVAPVTFTLYLDTNQTEGQGANVPPSGRPAIQTVNYNQPEYAINVRYTITGFDTSRVELFSWDSINNMWNPQIKNLVDPNQVAGGGITISPTLSYVELKIPKTAIGDGGSFPYMLSLALFSTTSNGATMVSDSVPDNGLNASVLNKFVSIADRVNLSIPVADQVAAPTVLPYTPYMYAETANVDSLRGFKVEVARDPQFTQDMEYPNGGDCIGCASVVDAIQNVYSPVHIYEDNTLYWRVFIKHLDSCGETFAPPSEAHIFTKVGPTPSNLQTSSQYSTPTFKWDDVESAAYYELQVASNPNFSSNAVDEYINHDNFTPLSAMTPGKYYWRVRGLNDTNGGYASSWSVSATVNITLPSVTLLEPLSGASLHDIPTFKWQSVLTPTNQPEWTGVTYHVQVADSPNGFTSPAHDYNNIDTITLTPWDSYPDKTYYWRVMVRDVYGNEGPSSQIYTFTKQYSITTLLEPLTGSQSGGFPTFKWTAIDGAAYYHIQIAKDAQYSQMVHDEYTDNIWYVLTDPLADLAYHWRVAMVDRYGNHGPYNDATLIISVYPYHIYLPAVLK